MPLPRKVRIAFATNSLLQRAGLLPSPERFLKQPMATRLAVRLPVSMTGPWPAGVTAEDHVVSGLAVRTYRGAGQQRPAPGVLYVHGGGFTAGGLPGSDHICARIADDSGATVVALEYGLAPEHPFPGPLDDCQTVLDWVRANADAIGIDPARLVVAGDSAGGNLAAALALRARRQGDHLVGQVLVYPALDQTRSTPAAQDYDGPGLRPSDLTMLWGLYAGADPEVDELLSPLLADDLTGLPPALVLTAEWDALRDEGRAYAVRLLEAGVACTALHHDDYAHGFLSTPRLYGGVDEAWAAIAGFLRRVTG